MKKNKQKNKRATQHKTSSSKRKKATQQKQPQSFFQRHKMALLTLFSLGFLLYIYTTSFDYVLDDRLYIIANNHTQKGFAGIPDIVMNESLHGFFGETKDLLVGGRYRPLAIITYAIEYQLFGAKPGLSHFINIILYALTGILLFRLLHRLLPPDPTKHRKWYLTLPFVATALFLVHPLHSEVVANIKGRVEILALLGALYTLYLSLKFIDTKKVKYLIFSGITFFLALTSKESAITFVAILPLTFYFFSKASIKDTVTAMMPIGIATIAFLAIRTAVLGYFISSGTKVTELLNDPFLEATVAEKFATIFYTLGIYIQLLFAPITLTHDYYPKQIPIINWADLRAIIPLILYVAMGLYALWGLRKKNVVAYGIAFYLITFSIVSNVFFPIGAFMNERFMYIPSVGFCLILGYLITRKLPAWSENWPKLSYSWPIILTGVLLFAYSLRTLARLPAWKSNQTLFLTDVHNSPNSTKANTSAGGTLIEGSSPKPPSKKRTTDMQKGIRYLNKALKIYPDNKDALLLLGGAHFDLNKDYDNVFKAYYELLSTNPTHVQVHRALSIMSETEEDVGNAKKLVNFYEKKVLPLNPTTATPYDALGVLYGKKLNNLEQSISYFKQALTYDDHEVGTYHDLAVAYGMQGRFEDGLAMANKALERDPGNAKTYLNIAITYQKMGQNEKAEEYFQQAFQLDPNLKQH